MDLSIENLDQVGGFTGEPVKREVTWDQNGESMTATVHIKPLSFSAVISDMRLMPSKSDSEDEDFTPKDLHDFLERSTAGRIAVSVVDAQGDPVFTPEDITGEADPARGPLNSNLTSALLVAISEVNSLGKPKPKRSQKKMKSGTS